MPVILRVLSFLATDFKRISTSVLKKMHKNVIYMCIKCTYFNCYQLLNIYALRGQNCSKMELFESTCTIETKKILGYIFLTCQFCVWFLLDWGQVFIENPWLQVCVASLFLFIQYAFNMHLYWKINMSSVLFVYFIWSWFQYVIHVQLIITTIKSMV